MGHRTVLYPEVKSQEIFSRRWLMKNYWRLCAWLARNGSGLEIWNSVRRQCQQNPELITCISALLSLWNIKTTFGFQFSLSCRTVGHIICNIWLLKHLYRFYPSVLGGTWALEHLHRLHGLILHWYLGRGGKFKDAVKVHVFEWPLKRFHNFKRNAYLCYRVWEDFGCSIQYLELLWWKAYIQSLAALHLTFSSNWAAELLQEFTKVKARLQGGI